VSEFVLSFDIGTTHLKAALVAVNGQMTALDEERLPMKRDSSGMAEHEVERLFRRFIAMGRRVVRGHEKQVRALVVSSYNLSLLGLDKKSRPLGGAMTLLDTRASETLSGLLRKVSGPRLYRRSGWPPIFHTPLAKLWWLKQRRPGLFKRARYFVGTKDYVLGRLLGSPVLDWSTAGATQLFDLKLRRWDPVLLKVLGIHEGQLAKLVDPGRVAGILTPGIARALRLPGGVAVVPGLYDAGALVAGTGAFHQLGVAALNLGTSAMLRCSSEKPLWHASGILQPVALGPGRVLNGGGVNNAGGALEWMAGILGLKDALALLSEASKAPEGASGVSALPHLSGERLAGAAGAAGAMLEGMLSGHSMPEIARAWTEGVGFSLRRILEALEEGGMKIRELRVAGGGARSDFWCAQLARILGKPLKRTRSMNLALLGNAALAWEALGSHGALKGLELHWRHATTFHPGRPSAALEAAYQNYLNLSALRKERHA
jgi:gluconokinase